jgi:hypothetical protein
VAATSPEAAATGSDAPALVVREPSALLRAAFSDRAPDDALVLPTKGTRSPQLVPLDQLAGAESASAPVESPAKRRGAATDEPSLPFTGFSLLALVLSGVAATAAGRRLQIAAEPPREVPAAPIAEPLRAVPAKAAPSRRPVYVGLALALAALAVSRAARA